MEAGARLRLAVCGQAVSYLCLIVGLPVVLVLMAIPRGRAWLYDIVNW